MPHLRTAPTHSRGRSSRVLSLARFLLRCYTLVRRARLSGGAHLRRTICVGLVVVGFLLGSCGVQPTARDEAPRRDTAGEEATSSEESTFSREEAPSAEEGPDGEETDERSAPAEETTPTPPVTTEGQAATEASAAELMPDIDPQPPEGLRVGAGEEGGFLLSFDAKFDNVGEGPLHIDGHRRGSSGPMAADQVVHRSDGSERLNPGVGELRFVESEDHRHWHIFRFMRYELVRPADGAVVAPDRKTGFCLGDRYDTDPGVRLPGEPRKPGAFDVPPSGDWCGRDDPGRSRLTMGLSVGYGDNYQALLDGQSIDVTDVPEGDYYLVHRVNAEVRESDYSNNASSVLLELRWPNGSDEPPAIEVLGSCADTARCSPEQPR
jgi:hypothetical protein